MPYTWKVSCFEYEIDNNTHVYAFCGIPFEINIIPSMFLFKEIYASVCSKATNILFVQAYYLEKDICLDDIEHNGLILNLSY